LAYSFDNAFNPAPKTPADIHIENIFIPGQDARTKIRLRIYQPKSIAAPTPVLICCMAADT